ncbi:MAG: EF-P lysine aminoacylase EpmA [Patescibacteria group bacterium]
MMSHRTILKEEKDRQGKFFLRAKIIALIRDFFYKEKFLEVETPSLVRLPGMEPHLDPIKVSMSVADGRREGYLVTSPEYAMKRILAAGFKKIFQICKSFRGGEAMDDLHNLEFTILEWYRANADYRDIMSDVENLMIYIAHNLFSGARLSSKYKIKYQGQIIDLSPPWPRLTVRSVFKNYAKMDLDKALTRESIARLAERRGYVVSKNDSFDDIFFKIFLSEIEPHLGKGKPIILYDWPTQMAALSRKKKNDPRYAERFEVYIGGLELGNAFSELVDADEQRKRLIAERNLRKKLGKEIYDIDEEFLGALKNMPPSGGIAMGVDRMVMFFTDAKKIDEIMFFPAKQIF